ncbi:hypothetical protein B1B12_08350 [Cutibacterium acnes subsp. defendens]|nr:hypothetical protein B1B02_03925 [Cutibacterium acnes subsp. defendens]PIS93489.1 hypothetical protein CER06_03075 [Cutibacterium acnes]PGF30954.1 hypothetical protein B1B08_03915 [Cutibacterium acnes subsp. defendens]PGF45310.1 hypothetical protein B1B12_08350 [Cutibacterium acnes subsp. defendens]PGF58427.1 hypothetical protein B1C79_09070 [Cutibacterium acnes subsp. defendens]
MAPFQWAKAAVRRQLPVILQVLFATSSDVDSDQIGRPNALVRPMYTDSMRSFCCWRRMGRVIFKIA